MRVACLYLPSWIGGLTLGIPSSLSAGSPRTRVRKAVDLSGRPGCIPDIIPLPPNFSSSRSSGKLTKNVRIKIDAFPVPVPESQAVRLRDGDKGFSATLFVRAKFLFQVGTFRIRSA